ncbi:MAG: ABC transporter permease subunit [Clostridia bacterium]|nr:ABC transporter permease subunit [Clostridia bacterium]
MQLVKKIAIAFGKALLVIAFWSVLWYFLSARIGIDLVFPTPKAVFSELWLLVTERSESLYRYGVQYSFWHITLVSLLRVVWGVLVSLIIGCLVAYLTSISRLLHTLLSPALTAIKATPVASFIILAMLWLDKSVLPVFITALIVVPIVWANVSEGIRAVDPNLREVATVYRFSLGKRVMRLYFPTVAPYFFAACQSALGMAWKASVAAEILAVPQHSIGTEIFLSKQYMLPETLFAWTLVVIVLSLIIETCFLFALRRLGQKFRMLPKGENDADT